METRVTALPKLFIGIDIHKRSWKIHCSTDLFAGKSFTMPPEPEKLRDYVNKHFPDYEMTTNWILSRLLLLFIGYVVVYSACS